MNPFPISLLALAALIVPAFTAEPRPNILIIVSDDLGYADAGFNGSKDIPTPHLDALAKSGLRCTSGYVTHPFCSPTRAALLTGRYQQRFGHENNPAYKPKDASQGLPLTEKLLPSYLVTAGWKTAWVGKWHLGATPEHAPWKRGFAESFGFIGGGHRYLDWQPKNDEYLIPLQRDGQSVEVPEHLTARFGAEASAFIHRHAAEPWFLYLAFNAPHTPHQPTPGELAEFSSVENPDRRKYAAQIGLMDDAIGQVLQQLESTGQRQRTLIFFFSDNGGPLAQNHASGPSNAPLRGGKGALYEGGVRVPFVISWPGNLPAGRDFDAPVSSLDVFATSLALAGVPMPTDVPHDGVNLIPFLKGDQKEAPHKRLFWRVGGGTAHAMREENWKLIRAKDKPPELYDLAADVSEKYDLAASQPEVVARLVAALDAWNKELIPPGFSGLAGQRAAKQGQKTNKDP
jgi:arylsulfatase A-like enzyme